MAKQTDLLAKVGSWAFIIGVILAIIIGLVSSVKSSPIAVSILILLGLIVGFLNVTGRETTPFLLAALALVIVSWMGGPIFNLGWLTILQSVLNAIMIFVIPATIIVALKAIYALAHDE